MLATVPTAPKSIDDYAPIIGDERVAELRSLAAPLARARVLNVNTTAFGGGVAEILGAMVPLMNDLGLHAEWQLVKGADGFFGITKAMHNSLQGMAVEWSPEMTNLWLHTNRLNAQLFDQDYDFVVIHDPQPAAILSALQALNGGRPRGRWVWRCHIDLTLAQREIWDVLRPYVEMYDAAVFTLRDYVKDGFHGPLLFTIPPAIDPLSPKNADLPEDAVRTIRERHGQDPGRPFITQVSRFDPWKDPLGVIEAYETVKERVPELQLVLIASMAHDDPEAWAWYEKTARRAHADLDILILTDLNGVGNVEVNAFQRSASVVLQKSLREGFGLVVSEALWKGRPVVAGNVGGIPLQIVNGETGYLADSVDEAAARVLELLLDPGRAAAMGRAGREFVREHFLITRYLRDYLRIFRALAGLDPQSEPARD